MSEGRLSNVEIAAVLATLMERLAGQLTAAEYAALHEAGLRLATLKDTDAARTEDGSANL